MDDESEENSCCGNAGSCGKAPCPSAWIQQRYIIAFMGALCILMQYILKVNLSVGIVAMVKPPASEAGANASENNYSYVITEEGENGEFDWDMEMQGHILSSYYYGYVATQFFGGYAADRWGGKIIVGPGIALTGLFTLFSPLAARHGGPWAFFAVRSFGGSLFDTKIYGNLSIWSGDLAGARINQDIASIQNTYPRLHGYPSNAAIHSFVAMGPEEKAVEIGGEYPETSGVQKPKGWIQQRYIFAIIGSLILMMQYVLKVNLSIGIVAMTKPSSGSNGSDEKAEEREFSWDVEIQGHILSAYYYGYVATQFFGGYASDRWGGKMIVGPGLALTGLFTLFSPVAARYGGPWALFAMRLLEGLCSGVVLPGLHYMFSLWFPPEERSSFSGAVFSFIGMAASGPLSKWPLEGGGWPMVFYFFGAIGIVLIIPWWLLVYDDPVSHPRISDEERLYILSGLGREEKTKEILRAAPVPWKDILTDVHVWAGIIFHWGTVWVLYTFISDLPTYMKTILHFDIEKVSLLSALPPLLTWIVSVISGVFSQWLRKKGYLTHLMAYKIFNGVASLGPAAGLIIINIVGDDPNTIVGLLAFSGMCMGAFFGGSFVNHMDLAVNFTGVLSGVLHTVVNSSGIIIPIVIAAIIKKNETIRQWSIVFYMVSGISIGTYIFYAIFGSVKERPWNHVDGIEKAKQVKK